jgi:hypothetical protein
VPGLYLDYDAWFRHDLHAWAASILLDARTLGRGYWNASTVRQLVHEHQQGRSQTEILGALISFELWQRTYLDD